MRVFAYLIKTLDNQVIDRILKSSYTQNNLIYNILPPASFLLPYNPILK